MDLPVNIRRNIRRIYCLSIAVWLAASAPAIAQDAVATVTDGSGAEGTALGGAAGGLDLNMNLDQLTRQDVVVPGFSAPVTTVERQQSTVGRTPAAVFVITPEMIKRSGARSIPDVLRMAPGVDVARVNAHEWAISIRGFNGVFADKLLVMIDRRIVYSATFGAVYWDMQNLILADIERIEVIRGPGTTMWGSNAVNGVINIITKNSSDTQGVLVQSGGGGQDQRDFNNVRYGGQLGGGATYRAWGQQFDRAAGWSANPADANDAWKLKQGGFRIDYETCEGDAFMLQGTMFNGKGGSRQNNVASTASPFFTDDALVNTFPGGNVLMQYTRTIDDETSWQLLSYYDNYANNEPRFLETRDTYFVEWQCQFSPWENHHFVAGTNYRCSPDVTSGSFSVSMEPASFTTNWVGVFVQDMMTLEEDRWYFVLGTLLEYNTFGGFEAEPTARLMFLPSERQTLWMAVSRAVRMPTRGDTDLVYHENLVPGAPVFLELQGNPNFQPENLLAYELGYRAAPTDYFTWDIAGYINDYRKVLGLGPIGAPVVEPNGFVIFPTMWQNSVAATSYGFETTATLQLTCDWRFYATYSLFEVEAEGDPTYVGHVEGDSPHNQIYLRSSWDLRRNVQFDVIGRYVDSLTGMGIPKYFEMDTRIGWQATETLEFSFVGQNLLNGHHAEWGDTIGGLVSTEVKRSWYGMVTWSF
jgi:iron complex outermembrane recepter protein